MTEIATYDWVCAGCKNKIKKGSEVVQMPYSHKEACKHGGYLYHRRCRPPLITTGEPIIKIEYDENYPEIKKDLKTSLINESGSSLKHSPSSPGIMESLWLRAYKYFTGR